MTYAGIGSRRTPPDIQPLITQTAARLANAGWTLRSGGAIGADQAFEKGANGTKEIYSPDDATPGAVEHATKFHPAWQKCSTTARLLHARNSMIILGPNLDSPVDLVICWTPSAQVVGGTGQALRIALAMGIRVCNLAIPEHLA